MNPASETLVPTEITSPGRETGSGRSISASAQLYMAQLAPMPIASEITATTVNAEFLASIRQP